MRQHKNRQDVEAEERNKEDGIGWGYFEGRTAEEWAGTAAATESERDAAIERAEEAERIGAEDEESLVRSRNEADRLAAELRQAIERANRRLDYWLKSRDKLNAARDENDSLRSTITQKDEQIEDVISALARWVDNDPSVSPGENIRMMQDELASQLRQKDEEIERLRHDREVASRYADWDEYDRMRTALHSIAEPGSVALDTIEDDGLIVTTQELQRCKLVARNALSTPETGGRGGEN